MVCFHCHSVIHQMFSQERVWRLSWVTVDHHSGHFQFPRVSLSQTLNQKTLNQYPELKLLIQWNTEAWDERWEWECQNAPAALFETFRIILR